MSTIFLSYVPIDAASADNLRAALAAQGYTVWPSASDSILSLEQTEQALRGSIAVVLVWSSAAATSEWVERHLLSAQTLDKPIVPVMLDSTPLPATVIAENPVAYQADRQTLIAQIQDQLNAIADTSDTDLLRSLLEESSDHIVRKRREAVTKIASYLENADYRERALTALTHIARHDPFMNIRTEAAQALAADTKKYQGSTQSKRSHMIGVRCTNHHISYFNKRELCDNPATVERHFRTITKTEILEFVRDCQTVGCGKQLKFSVDCEDC